MTSVSQSTVKKIFFGHIHICTLKKYLIINRVYNEKNSHNISITLHKWNKALRKFSWKPTSCGPLCKIHES